MGRDPTTGTPSFTTQGNAARTAEARTSPLTPGPFGFMPTSVNRSYQFPWANQWATSKCDPTQLLTPGSGADLSASVTNLFSRPQPLPRLRLLPRLHRGQLQPAAVELRRHRARPRRRPGDRQRPGRRADRRPAVVRGPRQRQPGHAAGRRPRHHQPVPLPADRRRVLLARASTATSTPRCLGHEYTHAISNRMVGGPDDGLTGVQAGAMGELVATWSRSSTCTSTATSRRTANPWAVGAYVTGNKKTGIRDYALDANPLNYSDVGFDTTGAEVHADGEIWNGTQLRASARRWSRSTTRRSPTPTARCSSAAPTGPTTLPPLPPEQCPGNRRWIQLMFDAFLLQQGDTTHARRARRHTSPPTGCASAAPTRPMLWAPSPSAAWAQSASTRHRQDDQPTPGFDSPLAENATVTFATGRRQAHDLRRPLRGPRHPARRHRSGDGARRDREARAGQLRRARPRAAATACGASRSRSRPARRSRRPTRWRRTWRRRARARRCRATARTSTT